MASKKPQPRVRAPLDCSRRAGLAGTLVAVAVAASGCSVKGAQNANLIVGKQQFVARCGACHTLARANTKGIVGPNLDASFSASVNEGLGRGSVRGVVEGQVKIPNPQGAMPKDLASGQTLTDIATYVAQAVDRPGPDTGLLASAVAAPDPASPPSRRAASLKSPPTRRASSRMNASTAVAKPGPVTITMPNMSGISHNIAVESGSGGATAAGTVLGASSYVSKGSASVSVTLKPGTYTYFCQAPGHRAAGMFGKLTVK